MSKKKEYVEVTLSESDLAKLPDDEENYRWYMQGFTPLEIRQLRMHLGAVEELLQRNQQRTGKLPLRIVLWMAELQALMNFFEKYRPMAQLSDAAKKLRDKRKKGRG